MSYTIIPTVSFHGVYRNKFTFYFYIQLAYLYLAEKMQQNTTFDLCHQMLLNTNILNCGVAYKGRDRDEAALKQHASKPGEQILPKKTVETSLPSPERKKAVDVLIEWNGLAFMREDYPTLILLST